jgi:predicted AlkP superfamily pyrophosphatase or phosphodiesterase
MLLQEIQKMKLNKLILGSFLLLATTLLSAKNQPKLIVQITVDQLRGDLPDKFMKNMGDGGFRYLKEEGVWYKNANYNYSNTETVVGHTTLATGANPNIHGMVSNVWYDRDKKRLVYNIEDKRYHILSKNADIDDSTEVDSSQALAGTDGRSPANIIVSTFSDELSLFTNAKSKIFAVSVKDRGAVTLGGHNGKAFWFSKTSGEFITSSYYYDKYPAWVEEFNKQKLAKRYENTAWTLMYDKSKYMFGDSDNNPWEEDYAGFCRVFPHKYGGKENKYFNHFLTFSPAGDELTLDFAKAIIKNERMGQHDVTDYLAISFSSTDYVGHLFGPSSLEAEDNMLRLDKTLASLFQYIDEKVGLENTLIVLSADHGAPEAPGYLAKFGIEAKWIAPLKWNKKPSLLRLEKQFGVGEDLIQAFFPPYIYLNHSLIKERGLNLAQVQKAVAKEIMDIDGVALTVTSTELANNTLPDTYLYRAALQNFNAKRSGDILILFEPHCFANDMDGGAVMATNHGGPWKYDTFVPVIFAGSHLKGKQIFKAIRPNDIAPTLSAIVNAKAPSGTDGKILTTIVKKFR